MTAVDEEDGVEKRGILKKKNEATTQDFTKIMHQARENHCHPVAKPC